MIEIHNMYTPVQPLTDPIESGILSKLQNFEGNQKKGMGKGKQKERERQ